MRLYQSLAVLAGLSMTALFGAGATPSSAQDAPACNVSQLAGGAFWQGATGSLAGGIVLENVGDTVCSLQGPPTLALADGDEAPLPVHESTYHTIVATPPIVTLQPGDQAWSQIIWMNWCGAAPRGGFYILLTLQGQTVAVAGLDGQPLAGTPRCDDLPAADATQPNSILDVSNFGVYPTQ